MGFRKLVLPLCLAPAVAKDAFVFLGATGDNALRESGVWQGIFEAYCGGEFDKVGGVDIHVAMNMPHTADELRTKVKATLAPLHDALVKHPGWACKTKSGDCSVATFIGDITVNIQEGRDANAQAADMAPALKDAARVTVYLSLPPFVFGSWSEAAIGNWGRDRVHVAAEKPFGTSTESADKLYQAIVGTGMPKENLHLVDHWLSFFMTRHMLELRAAILPRLASKTPAAWNSRTFEKVVVTEFEERGLDGRGGFFDGVGQVRDMIQSHLLQVLSVSVLDTSTPVASLSESKLALFNKTSLGADACKVSGQYDGFLLEPKLKFHGSFADTTLVAMDVNVDTEAWKDTQFIIQTGKSTGATVYTVAYHQRDGPGVLTFEMGAEEVGVAGVRVENWPLTDSSSWSAPGPGFGAASIQATPNVIGGTGWVVNYDTANLYFPKPYAMMSAALLTRQYGTAFVTYEACRRSWEIVTGSSPSVCLDKPPQEVLVYTPPSSCGNTAPSVCFGKTTVKDLYDDMFACTPAHGKKFKDVSLYKAKCSISAVDGYSLFV
jgi:glucose-6-phosphate 1-dehydrogenase